MRKKSRSKKAKVLSTVLNREDLLEALQDFTNKDNWDEFYRLRLGDGAFEWYTEWAEYSEFLTEHLMWLLPKEPQDVRILVPGCGNSSLSDELYDVGFMSIVNVDFSKVVIMNMKGLHWIRQPKMKWRVMDMTQLQFVNGSFDAVVDKGGLDSLTDSFLNPRLGNLYLSEVKRVLAAGGKFICFTLAQSHVLDMLLHKFRFGWHVRFHAIAQGNAVEQIVVFVAVKDSPNSMSHIPLDVTSYSNTSYYNDDNEAMEFLEAVKRENCIRTNYLMGHRTIYSLEQLVLGAIGNIQPLQPGRRIDLILGEPGVSNFSYSCVLIDNISEAVPMFPYVVYLVPHSKARANLLSAAGAQWDAEQKAARLLMVFLDSSNSSFSMEEIKADLLGLVKHLIPSDYDHNSEIEFFTAFKEIKRHYSVHKVMSYLTGPIMVEDVVHEDSRFRRLIFERSENLIQSEGLLYAEKGLKNKGIKRKFSERLTASPRTSSSNEMGFVRDTLESDYHKVIISGILLIGSYLSLYTTHRDLVKTVILGLGGGLLPMFMKNNIPSLNIEVVELDQAVLRVARDYFFLEEDRKLNVRIGDAIEFVKERTCGEIDILILDVDLSDPSSTCSSGLSCPSPGFLEEPFLRAANRALTDQGVFVLNLITRSSSTRIGAYSCMKKVFCKILRVELEEDSSEVLFALKMNYQMTNDHLYQARHMVVRNLDPEREWSKFVFDFTSSMHRVW